MDAYIYQADMYCTGCAEAIRCALLIHGKAPANPDDQATYDSDVYPKGPFSDAGGESDSVQHCACGEDCMEPTEIGGELHGKFLENDLTQAGVANLNEMIRENPRGEVVQFWAAYYRDHGYWGVLDPSDLIDADCVEIGGEG